MESARFLSTFFLLPRYLRLIEQSVQFRASQITNSIENVLPHYSRDTSFAVYATLVVHHVQTSIYVSARLSIRYLELLVFQWFRNSFSLHTVPRGVLKCINGNGSVVCSQTIARAATAIVETVSGTERVNT